MTNHRKPFAYVGIMILSLSFMTGCMHFRNQKPDEAPDLSQPRQSFYSAPLDRLNSGLMNIVTGPLELVYQLKEEIKQKNFIVGLFPGVVRGISWFASREVIGAFEVGTFFLPLKPHLAPFDMEWLQA